LRSAAAVGSVDRPTKEDAMPLVTVKVFERRLDSESEARIIQKLTDALLEALEAEDLRDHTWVLVEGYDPHRWGRGGKPWE
jgi:phenylpyruvate tautomerase PptA (4-oxalocrotonate tautomerase family)